MNISESFAEYLVSLGIGTLGQNIFIGNAPSSNMVIDSIWWIVSSGGNPIRRNSTGESLKSYTINVFYRDRDYKTVYDELNTLEESINCDNCTALNDYDTISIEANSFPIDNDLDNEDRKVGLLQVNLTTYKECI
jgi:hypothetical protein